MMAGMATGRLGGMEAGMKLHSCVRTDSAPARVFCDLSAIWRAMASSSWEESYDTET